LPGFFISLKANLYVRRMQSIVLTEQGTAGKYFDSVLQNRMTIAHKIVNYLDGYF
jgi:hypothetical protein